jgi:hypothetical protein
MSKPSNIILINYFSFVMSYYVEYTSIDPRSNRSSELFFAVEKKVKKRSDVKNFYSSP